MKTLTKGETHLYFFLYLTLATAFVIWVGVMGGSMIFPMRVQPRDANPPATPISTPATKPAPVKPGATPSLYDEVLTDWVNGSAHLCGVPAGVWRRLVTRESGWRVSARGSKGRDAALGLAQIKPSTLRGVSPRLRHWVPTDRLVGAACYLRMLYDKEQGDERSKWHRALLSYRYGPNRKRTPSTRYADVIMEGEE